jgi:hypothetical protein
MLLMKRLPKCITHLILKYLNTEDLIRFRRSCKYYDELFRYNLRHLTIDLSYYYKVIEDRHLQFFQGVHTINLDKSNITDKGLQYLKGVHTSDHYGTTNITAKGLL